ncbi:hypothetical protein BB560_002239 [Smittium megazygosporum]|uniref:Major facilitator superfamily (MFS) profile domain-containing protein n=1 Tax=Smittium megazygosporum TaxID=133381 RepID=A0A2T9ZFB4_9FUNG|nr:hypothetical protein BB560_002239 [Smittium megazygosporum]
MSEENRIDGKFKITDVTDKARIQINILTELTEEEKAIAKSALRKTDLRIIPIVVLIYLAAMIDRSNIGAALVNGLKPGLKLNNRDEGLVTSIFYVFYILCEVPSNMLLKRFRPHSWFGFIGTAWSTICLLMAFIKSGALFIVARAALGALESGFCPGVISYLGYWYTRTQISYRMTLFFCAAPLSGIIGNPLAAALVSIKLGKFMPFQTIFLFEGAITLAFCIVAFFIIKDYPEEAKFFTPEEKALVVSRLRIDQGMASEAKVDLRQTVKFMLDWRIWAFAQINFGIANFYVVVTTFSPTVIRNLGYTGTAATYLASLPSLAGLFGCFIVLGLYSRFKYSDIILFFGSIAIIGYICACYFTGKVIRITFISISGFGLIPVIPVLLSWMSVNQGGIYKGSIASAIVVSYCSISGAISPNFFVTKYSPKFVIGNAFAICAYTVSLALTVVLKIYFSRQNRYRDENPVDISHLSEEEQRLMNDSHPQFRYKC